MINPPKTFTTQRLLLRKAKIADAEAIFREYAQDSEVTKFVSWRAHRSLAETKSYVRACSLSWNTGKAFHWVIERRSDSLLMGMIIARANGEKWELGFVLGRRHWDHGYMTEAVKAISAWALSQDEIYRIWAVCDVDNAASARVMEKAGMQREGTLRRWSMHPNISDKPRDSYCYSIVK